MSDKNCAACNDLREYASEFSLSGVTDNVACSLFLNEGLSDDDDRTNCEDLLDVNDCLIGNMQDELDKYDVCEWKDFMSAFIGNLYDTLKAMLYSECGLLTKIDLLTINPKVSAFRNGGTGSSTVEYWGIADNTDLGTLKVYMDATDNASANASANGTYGSTPADRDYIALLTWCADGQYLNDERCSVQVSVRNNTQSASDSMLWAQHYSVKGVESLSINQTGFCYLPEGGHLLVRTHCSKAPDPSEFRVHQFSMVLLPVVNANLEC